MEKTKNKSSLTRNLLISLGIPTVFIPGLVLAAVLGWNWQKDLSKLAKFGGYKQSSQIFPTKTNVINVLNGDTFEIDNRQKDLIEGKAVRLEYNYFNFH